MSYELLFPDKFIAELLNAPQKISKAWQKKVSKRLREDPATEDRSITRLEQNRDFWRYKQNEYRFVYKCDLKSKVVTMWTVGKRDEKFYTRLGLDRNRGPTARVIANPELHTHFGINPSQEEQARALVAAPREIEEVTPQRDPEDHLPKTLNARQLTEWNIPSVYHAVLEGIDSGHQLLSACIDKNVPDEIFDRIHTALYPPTVEQIVNSPLRVIPEGDAMDDALKGHKKLEEFLLALDGEQKPFVRRFEDANPTGPWMIKGGPGSGKSTVALYCIKGLIDTGQSMLRMEREPLRILFTTFTRSLVSASEHLLNSLGIDRSRYQIDALNIDALSMKHLPPGKSRGRVLLSKNSEEVVSVALRECITNDRNFSFSIQDSVFLLDEVEWVIIGEGCETEDSYLTADRSGRGRRLGGNQRRQLWQFHKSLQRHMRKQGYVLLSERLADAASFASRQYDYVFIDEAQDLKPIAIRMCIGLAKDPSNVFLTADPNQTIYGSNMPWKRVSEDLNFRGRSKIFKRNYRTTHEICEAIRPIIDGIETTDIETLSGEPVYHGDHPTLGFYSSNNEEADHLGTWLRNELFNQGLLPSCGAVLCPTNRDCERVAHDLPKSLNARAFNTKNLDLSHRGVKVLTMHASKGLQFPVVAVTGLEEGKMPWRARGGMDEQENEIKFRRLFFVACSRAMKSLLVLGSKNRPSPFLDDLDRDDWNEID